MITGEEFLDLARIRLAPVFREFGFREIGAGVETTYAELKTNHQTRSLKIGMDRAQDYRVYAQIRRLGRMAVQSLTVSLLARRRTSTYSTSSSSSRRAAARMTVLANTARARWTKLLPNLPAPADWNPRE